MAVSLLLAMLVGPAYTASEGNSRQLTVALAEVDYPPFYFIDEGQLTGISIEVLDHIASLGDFHFSYRRLSWPRVLNSLETGMVDMVSTFFNTAERAPHVVYTGIPHAYEINNFFSRSDSSITYEGDLWNMSAYRIGVIRGYSYGAAFDNAGYLSKVEVPNEANLVRMLVGSRFEVLVGNPFAIKLEATRKNFAEQIRLIEPPVDRSPIYMAVTRQHPRARQIAGELTGIIYELKKTSKYQQMVARYGL